jgi:hypothetical protein
MKKILAFSLSIAIFFSSCSLKFFPLKGSYPKTPIIVHSEQSFDSAWDKLVDLFAQQGIGIRIIDRSSGFISSSDETEVPASYEDRKGKLYHPLAYVVLKRNNQQEDAPLKKYVFHVTGVWNVHIKREASGVSINVNLVNLKSFFITSTGQRLEIATQAQTTGNFEKIISDILK